MMNVRVWGNIERVCITMKLLPRACIIYIYIYMPMFDSREDYVRDIR